MRIAIGSDHAGYFLKEALEAFLEQEGYGVVDMGCDSPDPVDYPDIAARVGRAVSKGEVDRGLLVCGSGIGVSIAANKIPGVRAARVDEPVSARLSREHNDANILCLGGRLLGEDMARRCCAEFFTTDFSGGRHRKRVEQIADLEKANSRLTDIGTSVIEDHVSDILRRSDNV